MPRGSRTYHGFWRASTLGPSERLRRTCVSRRFVRTSHTDDAIRHFEAGFRIGELGEHFEGVLPWGMIDNRPFLHCMHSFGLCHWRLGRFEEAGLRLRSHPLVESVRQPRRALPDRSGQGERHMGELPLKLRHHSFLVSFAHTSQRRNPE